MDFLSEVNSNNFKDYRFISACWYFFGLGELVLLSQLCFLIVSHPLVTFISSNLAHAHIHCFRVYTFELMSVMFSSIYVDIPFVLSFITLYHVLVLLYMYLSIFAISWILCNTTWPYYIMNICILYFHNWYSIDNMYVK